MAGIAYDVHQENGRMTWLKVQFYVGYKPLFTEVTGSLRGALSSSENNVFIIYFKTLYTTIPGHPMR